MTVPVTTGGKKRTQRPKNGATRTVNTPEPMTAPMTPGMPRSGLVPVAMIEGTAVNEIPIMIGRRMPTFQMPSAWMRVTMPQQNRSALTSIAICSLGK